MTKTRPSPIKQHTVWQGLLNPTAPLIRALAHQTVVDIEAALWPRFCAKITYWQTNSAHNPITLRASRTELFPLHRGCSRLVAGVLYQRAMPMHIWSTDADLALIQTVMTQAKMTHTRRLPDSEQNPIRGFESSIHLLKHTYFSKDWLLEALESAERPKKILTLS